MADRVKLTNSRVRDLKPAAKARLVYDSVVTGFCVVVTPAGSKSWYWYGWQNGRPRRIRIGGFPAMNADTARQEARAAIGDVARGVNISERKHAGRRTVATMVEAWVRLHAKPKGLKTLPKLERVYEQHIKGAIGSMPIAAVRREHVAELLTAIQGDQQVGSARRAHDLLSSAFSLAVKLGWIEFNPMSRLPRPDVPPRERYLRQDEAVKFLEAVHALRNPTARDFFLLCVHTGARNGNVASMAWSEIDGDRWVIPATKAKRKKQMIIPLTEEARRIINGRQGNRSMWVLPGRSRDGHYKDAKAAMRSLRKRSGLENLRTHDLRRTLATWMGKEGSSVKLAAAALGHSDVATTLKHYQQVEHGETLAAMEAATAAMLGAGAK